VADRVAAALVVAAALTIMAVAGQTPEPRPGLGVLALALLGGWLWYRRRAARSIVALAVAGDGRFWTEYQDGRRVDSDAPEGLDPFAPGSGSQPSTERREDGGLDDRVADRARAEAMAADVERAKALIPAERRPGPEEFADPGELVVRARYQPIEEDGQDRLGPVRA